MGIKCGIYDWKEGHGEDTGKTGPSYDQWAAYPYSQSVRVDFDTAYSSPPHVQLSVVSRLAPNDNYDQFAVDVEQVDEQGFTMRAFTGSPGFLTTKMHVAWMSIE